MKLFYKSGACSLSPHIVLEESGLAYEMEAVDLKAKTLSDGGNYLDVNPKGSVPALQTDDGDILTEGPAIVQFIADKAGKAELAPVPGTIARYRLQEWLNFISSELHKSFAPLFKPDTPDDYKAIAKKTITAKFAVVDAALGKDDYLLGMHFSAADAYLYTVTRWSAPLGIELTDFPALRAFMARVDARPPVQAVLKAEGLSAFA